MLEKRIRLREVNEVIEFVCAAGKCEFDVDIYYDRIPIDAKSIMGVLSLDLTKPLIVQYTREDSAWERVRSKFVIA